MERAEFDLLRRLQYALVEGPEERRGHAERGGFCPRHTWVYEPLTSPRAIGFAYPPVLEALAARMRSLAREGPRPAPESAAALAAWSPSARNCPACVEQGRAEGRVLRALARALGQGSAPPEAESPERPSPPMCCLPHLARLAPLLEPPALTGLLRRQADWLDALAADMRNAQGEDLAAGSPLKSVLASSALAALAGSRRTAAAFGPLQEAPSGPI